jgi:hypothetical protein
MVRLPALVLAALLVTGLAEAFPRCAPGTFDPLVAPIDGYPLAGGSSPSGAFMIGENTIAMGACGSTTLHVRARQRNTVYRALWPDCSGFVVSVLRWRDRTTNRRRALKFESLRAAE